MTRKTRAEQKSRDDARRPKTVEEGLARMEKKLRQARYFLAGLRDISSRQRDDPEPLEFCFSATLTAVQSAFDVIANTSLRARYDKWQRSDRLNAADRAFLKRMKDHRDDDVHWVVFEKGTTQPKYIEWRRSPGDRRYAYFMPLPMSPGHPVATNNPDDTRVRGDVLTTVPALYLRHDNKLIEAPAVCEHLLALYENLVRYLRQAIEPDRQS